MARKTASRLELRKQAEAAEGQEASKVKGKRKKATRKKSTRSKRAKEKASQRKRLVWGVFSASMKEEARFPYDQREEADAKADQLRSKSKKLFFVQPIKEVISESAAEEKKEEKAGKK